MVKVINTTSGAELEFTEKQWSEIKDLGRDVNFKLVNVKPSKELEEVVKKSKTE